MIDTTQSLNFRAKSRITLLSIEYALCFSMDFHNKEKSVLINQLQHKPSELVLLKHQRNLLMLDVIQFTKNEHGETFLQKTSNSLCLLQLPGFSIYELFMMLNGAEQGMLELSVYLVFIIRYFEEVLPLRKQVKDEEFGPIKDDMGIALVLALDAMNTGEDEKLNLEKKEKENIPTLKGQHMNHIRYRVKDTMVVKSNKKLLANTDKRIKHLFGAENKCADLSFQQLYDKCADLFIGIYEWWNCKVIEQSKSTFYFSSKFKKLVG